MKSKYPELSLQQHELLILKYKTSYQFFVQTCNTAKIQKNGYH
jgi:hypothetical protein